MKEKEKKDKKDTVVPKWAARYRKSFDNLETWFKKTSDWYDLLYAHIDDDDFMWHSRVFEPILTSKTWNIIAKTIGGDPGWNATPIGKKDELSDAKALAIESLLKYFSKGPHSNPSLKEKLCISLLDSVVSGIGYGKVPWITKEISFKQREFDEMGVEKDKVKDTKKPIGYPDFENLAIYDVLPSPSTNYSIHNAPWVIVRSFSRLSDMKFKNEKTPGYYQNLSGLKTKPISDTDDYSKSRNRLVQENSDDADNTIDIVENWECYEKEDDKIFVTVISNRNTVTRPRRQLDYWHGKYPLVDFRIKPKGKSLIGESLFETNERLVWGMNDLTNHFLDAWNLANNPMVMQEETTIVDSYEVAPGNQITYKGDREPKPFTFPMPPVRAYQGIRDTLAADIEQNTISGYQTGNPTDTSDKTAGTKGGIIAIQSAGSDILDLYRGFFMKSVKEIGYQWMRLIQQYLDRDIFIKISGYDKDVIVPIGPDIIQGEFDLELDEISMLPRSKEAEAQTNAVFLDKMLSIYGASQQSPNPISLNWESLAKDCSSSYDKSDASKYIVTTQEVSQLVKEKQQEQIEMAQSMEQPEGQPMEQPMGMPPLPPEEGSPIGMPPLPPEPIPLPPE